MAIVLGWKTIWDAGVVVRDFSCERDYVVRTVPAWETKDDPLGIDEGWR